MEICWRSRGDEICGIADDLDTTPQHTMNPTRRTLLRNVSTLTATLAGAGAAAATTTAQEDSAGAAPRSIVGAQIRTTSRECGSEDWSRSKRGRTTVTIEGQLTASTPCHDAAFRSIVQRDDTLYVTIGLEPQQTFAPCILCLGTIGYEATIEFAETAGITDVVVRHESDGATPPIRLEDD